MMIRYYMGRSQHTANYAKVVDDRDNLDSDFDTVEVIELPSKVNVAAYFSVVAKAAGIDIDVLRSGWPMIECSMDGTKRYADL